MLALHVDSGVSEKCCGLHLQGFILFPIFINLKFFEIMLPVWTTDRIPREENYTA